MSTTTYIKVLLLISKHEREGIITHEKGAELHKLFKSLYEKGTPTSLILDCIK